uniref:Lysine exporter protein LysE n=1 Tax=Kitasatospora aburaviensis TaxID=67265 RepID=A0A1D3P9W7_9ACTN|nr:lysine exporter protein LysE [Kitasatospora aburaviensis]
MTGIGTAAAALAGIGAGLGVAVPLGAVGVLLLEEGRRGRSAAVSAACAVAFVDAAYAALATALGSRLASTGGGWEAWARVGSAVVLTVVAVRGLLGLRRPPAAPSGAAVLGGPGRVGGPGGAFLRFTALTAVNPTTALYFAALVTGGGGPRSAPAGAAFVVGVLAASLLWQQLLAAVGVSVGARLSARARGLSYCVGYGLVVCYAVRTAWPR